jgi:hypothetical protein
MSSLQLPGHKAGWCVNYRYSDDEKPFGERSKTCKAGVEYARYEGQKIPLPCFLTKTGESKPDAAPCECIRRPTPEEIAARAEWQKASMARLVTVLQGIADWRKKYKSKSHSEVVECPACRGRLHLSIAACNGHVHGRCESDGCVAWME